MPKQLFENTTKTPRTFYGVTLQPGEQKLIDVPPETVLPPAPAVVQRDPVTKKFTAGGVALPELDYLVSGDVIVNARDGMGRVTSYTQGGVTYTVTYGNFGPATVSGGGQVTTYNYSAAGLLLSTTTV
ncbi:MAG: hypothetical protein ACK44A_04975 [Roseateles sp.]